MASEKNKIKALQEFSKSIRRGEGGAAIGKALYYLLKPTPVDVSKQNTTTKTKKNNTKKYASIGTSQMRSGRSSTIQTSSTGLMSKATIGKKTLLGG
jgi:hypothetical protein